MVCNIAATRSSTRRSTRISKKEGNGYLSPWELNSKLEKVADSKAPENQPTVLLRRLSTEDVAMETSPKKTASKS